MRSQNADLVSWARSLVFSHLSVPLTFFVVQVLMEGEPSEDQIYDALSSRLKSVATEFFFFLLIRLAYNETLSEGMEKSTQPLEMCSFRSIRIPP